MEKIGIMNTRLSSPVERLSRQRTSISGEFSSSFPLEWDRQPPLSCRTFEQNFLDRYEILEVLNAGGQGIVYRARDPMLQRDVAIKLGRKDVCAASVEYSRILNEGALLARIHHPNLPTVYDSGVNEGRPYLVLELIDGIPLKDVVRSSPPTRKQVIRWMQEIASAVQASHQAGILHLDLKPENVLVTPDGHCKLIDFGLGWFLNRQEAFPFPITMGTPGYLAPEQQEGNSQQWTEATDVYGLGEILQFLLNGCSHSRPRSESITPEFKSATNALPRPPKRKLCRLTQISLKARSLAPCDRYPNVRSFLRSLTAPRRIFERLLALFCVLTGVLSLLLGMAANPSLLGSIKPNEHSDFAPSEEENFVALDLLVRTRSDTPPLVILWTPTDGLIPIRGMKPVPEEDNADGFAWRPATPKRSLIANFQDPVCCLLHLAAPIDHEHLERILEDVESRSASTPPPAGVHEVLRFTPSHPTSDPIPPSIRNRLATLQRHLDKHGIRFTGQFTIQTEQDFPRWDIQMVFPALDNPRDD